MRFGLLLLPGFSMMALAAASEPLRAANRLAGSPLFEWKLVGIGADAVASSSGFGLLPHLTTTDEPEFDAVIVVASLNIFAFRDPRVFAWLRWARRARCAIGAVSTGSFILARAGLLDGYRCTVHWEMMTEFAEEFPTLRLARDLYVIDRDRFTCGGGIAGLDMMLTLIARRHGQPLAAGVAEQFLHTRIRSPADSQRMDIVGRHGTNDTRLVSALALMEQHIERPLPTEAVAIRAGVSGRQLERLFHAAFGQTPNRFYRRLRLGEARRRLHETDAAIAEIALRCGFATASHFGRAYREAFGASPGDARRRRTTVK